MDAMPVLSAAPEIPPPEGSAGAGCAAAPQQKRGSRVFNLLMGCTLQDGNQDRAALRDGP